MRQLAFTDEEVNKMIEQALLDAAKILLRPGVKDIVEQAASVREAGLDSRYHVSPERMDQILQDVKDAQNRSIVANEALEYESFPKQGVARRERLAEAMGESQ
jgi:hypothetical protein